MSWALPRSMVPAPGSSIAVAAFAAAILCGTAAAHAAEGDPPGTHRDWGVGWRLGGGSAGGGYGEFLEDGLAWDLDIFKQRGHWRFGAGLMFESLTMKAPYHDEPEWAHFEPFAYATRVFQDEERVRPYLQGRLGIVRMHPRSELFLKKPFEELEPGESPTDAVNGLGISLIPGAEFDLTRGFALDLSMYLDVFATGDYDLEPIGRADTGDGVEWGARIGARWRPLSFDPPEHVKKELADTTALPPPNEYQDAWGVTRSPGWAAAEILGINFGASMFNEYVRQANFNQISPRSFWHNLEEGFDYDDNKFKTNQYIHPFNGSTYFNSGRANGLGFWPSTICALTGAFIWESMGETHPMSFNDMIATGVGGIAFGETVYRLSSSILDNTHTGNGRTWREIGAFLVNPVRGFNRFVSGRAGRIEGNPSDPHDWRPPHYDALLGVGVRITGKGESITDSTVTQGVIDLYLNHGSPLENARREPFDHFDIGLQMNGDDKTPIGRFQIRGDLVSKTLGDPAAPRHAIAFTQYFDYVNNNAYEFGGQSFGGTLYSRFKPSSTVGIDTRVDLSAMLLGAVNSNYSYLVVTPDQERQREYDYGPGAGFSLEAAGSHRGRRILLLYYRAQWIDVRNGSIYVPAGNPGSNATHFVHAGGLRLTVPVRGAMGVGLDAMAFVRDSNYSDPNLIDEYQRVPQVRMYLAWDVAKD